MAYSLSTLRGQARDAWNRAVATDGPVYTGSYFERFFINPIAETAFSMAGGTVKGLWRGVTYRSPFSITDYVDLWEDIRNSRGIVDFFGNVVHSATQLPGRVAGTALGTIGWATGAASRMAALPLAKGTVGLANTLAAATPPMLAGAALQAVATGASAVEKAAGAARWIWNSPLMSDTRHWSGAFGARQFIAPVEAGILAVGAGVGLFRGGLAAFNAHRLGWVDTGQLEGTLTEARNFGEVDRGSDMAWYDTDADGSLVFALNKLRNRR